MENVFDFAPLSILHGILVETFYSKYFVSFVYWVNASLKRGQKIIFLLFVYGMSKAEDSWILTGFAPKNGWNSRRLKFQAQRISLKAN